MGGQAELATEGFDNSQPQTSSSSNDVSDEIESVMTRRFANMVIDCFTSQGLRDGQEDRLVSYERGNLKIIVVADGHAGQESAEWIAQNFPTIIEEKFSEVQDTSQRLAALTQAMREADMQLLNYLATAEGLDDDERKSGAACSVLVFAREGPHVTLYVANVGDCHVVASKGGKAHVLTKGHRVYGSDPVAAVEIERIKSVGGWVTIDPTGEDIPRVMGQLAVARAFGDSEYKIPGLATFVDQLVADNEITPEFRDGLKFTGDVVTSEPHVARLELTPEVEFVHIATDGVWDAITTRDLTSRVRSMLRKGRNVADVCQKLNYQLRASHDNTAYVLIDLLGPEGPAYWKEERKATSVMGKVSLFGWR